MKSYLDINKELWNNKVPHHLASDFYDMPAFLGGQTSLKHIELALLGDITGKRVLHLQCHFGQDSISLARMGAQVTAVDFSEKAIEVANDLNQQTGQDVRFICADIYSLPDVLDEQFDIVFTSYGTIGWLPDMDKWAQVVTHFMKPGGTFIFVEFHPVVWMLDDAMQAITYRYFKDEPIIEVTEGTYADPNAQLKDESISWNHGLAEVVSALLKQGLSMEQFEEYDYSPYACFQTVTQEGPEIYRPAHLGNKIPMTYALVMTK
jgi:ubiquinone/menaquinone biosynthesis C-methylase UbiE